MSDSSRHLPLDPDSVDGLWHELHGHIRPRVGSADRADDVVQEAFLNALRHPPPDPKGLGAWLQVVARHLASRNRRRERSRLERERLVATARGSVKIEASAPGVELREALRLLACLDEPYREVLRLRYLDGFEIEEIAHQLARSPGTVRSQIKRGLDRLRRRLGRPATRERRPWALALVRPLRRLRDQRSFARAARGGALLSSTGLCALVAVLLHEPRAARASGSDAAPASADIADISFVLHATKAREEREHVSPEVAPPQPPAEPVERAWRTSLAGRVLEAGPAAGSRDARAWIPKAGVAILARAEEGDAERVVAYSGADGRFQVDGVDGRDWIWARAEGGPASSMHLAASAQGNGELDLRIGRASATTTGRLLAADGGPIANATITVLGRPMRPASPWIGDQGTLELSPLPVTVRTDEQGRFHFRGEGDEPVRLLIDATGQAPALRLAPWRGHEAAFELVLPSGGSIGGRLLTSDGAPLGGAHLGLRLPQPLPGQEAATDVAGWFRFEHVPAGPYELVLLGDARGGESLRGGGTLREGEELERDVRCSPVCTIHGRALRSGASLAGWSVELERMLTDDFPDRRSVQTDELGRFSFASCSVESRHLLRLTDPLTGRVLACKKLEEGTADDVCLTVDPREAPARLVGTIESADPEHPAIFVEVWNNWLSSRWMAPVDPRTGGYAFDALPSGIHRVSAWLRGSGPVTFGPVDLGSGEVVTLDRRVERSGALRLQLDLPARVRREQIEVVVTVPSLHSSNPRTTRRLEPGAPGAPFLARLPPGDYEYAVRIEGVLAARRRFAIQPEQTTDDVVHVPDFVEVALALASPRALGEHEPVSVCVLSGGAWNSLAFSAHFRDALPILLPVDATRLRVESRLGLVGEWTRAAPPYEGEVLEIALAPPKD